MVVCVVVLCVHSGYLRLAEAERPRAAGFAGAFAPWGAPMEANDTAPNNQAAKKKA